MRHEQLQSIVMSMSVRMSVCLSVREDISRTTCAVFTNFFVHVAYVHGSVLRRRCDTLCTEIVPEQFLVLFRPRTTSVRSGLGTFFVPLPEHAKHFLSS